MKRRIIKKISILLLVSFVLLGGCSGYKIPQISTEHPAHPKAKVHSKVPSFNVLDIDIKDLPKKPPEFKDEPHSMHNM